ncbi:unnamed protein product [Cladocopium goreaui]|uniref:Glycosyltransferase n=1 Tax=Cladocopium goreaui TaxID=2562237 RepID=A0A9P1CEI9_9DINO|nr:unnamed protein product [Cladocopium goreaui]
MDFGMRHLTDRKEFLEEYSKVSLQQHPCGEAPEAMLRMRLEKLLECQQISEEVLGLLQATVSHLLCAACRGGVESNAALMVDAEVALSDEWKRLSVATQKIYQEIRAHDAAIAGQMRQVGAEACIMDFIEAQRRGVPAHGTHVMKIRPWHSDEGLGGVKSRRLFPQHFPNWLELSRVVPEDAACYILIYMYNIILYNYIYIYYDIPSKL